MKRPIDPILSRLDGVKRVGSRTEWWALCPIHGEKTPSLHVTQEADGMILLHCFGCGAGGADVMERIGLSLGGLFPDRPFTERDSGDKWNPHREPSKTHYERLIEENARLRAKVGE